jgi:hypothetical protein
MSFVAFEEPKYQYSPTGLEITAIIVLMLMTPALGRRARRIPEITGEEWPGYWFLWVRCPACRMINAVDLRTLDRHRDAAVTTLIPALSCRSCRPNAPFAELVRLSRMSIADEMREEYTAPDC